MPKITKQKKDRGREIMAEIHAERQLQEQDLGWLFRPLAVCPFPAAPQGKREIIEDGKRIEEYKVLWTRKAGNVKVEVLGHPDYGIPHGQDTLIVLYLAYEARRQGSRKIRVNFYRDFMRMFKMEANDGRKYRLVVQSLQRIRNARYSWEVMGENRERGLHFLYIDEYDLYCDPKQPEQRLLFDQYIILSERFWEEIRSHKIPSNLKAIIYLKAKPAHLNFYIWLSYRIGAVFQATIGQGLGPEEILIPFWGTQGLQEQMSSVIERRNDFRIQVKKWMKSVREVWPRCPVEIEDDALRIFITSEEQLDVQGKETNAPRILPKPKKELPVVVSDNCPLCGQERILKLGQTSANGQRLPDYWECTGGCGRTPAAALCKYCQQPMEMMNKGRADYTYFCARCQNYEGGENYWIQHSAMLVRE